MYKHLFKYHADDDLEPCGHPSFFDPTVTQTH